MFVSFDKFFLLAPVETIPFGDGSSFTRSSSLGTTCGLSYRDCSSLKGYFTEEFLRRCSEMFFMSIET